MKGVLLQTNGQHNEAVVRYILLAATEENLKLIVDVKRGMRFGGNVQRADTPDLQMWVIDCNVLEVVLPDANLNEDTQVVDIPDNIEDHAYDLFREDRLESVWGTTATVWNDGEFYLNAYVGDDIDVLETCSSLTIDYYSEVCGVPEPGPDRVPLTWLDRSEVDGHGGVGLDLQMVADKFINNLFEVGYWDVLEETIRSIKNRQQR